MNACLLRVGHLEQKEDVVGVVRLSPNVLQMKALRLRCAWAWESNTFFHFEKSEMRFRQNSTSLAHRSPRRYAEQTTPNERKVQRSWHNQARISTYAERGSPQPRNSQIRPK